MTIHTEIGLFFGAESTYLAKHPIFVLEFWSGAGSTWSSGVEQLYPELEPCQTGPKSEPQQPDLIYLAHFEITISLEDVLVQRL